MPIKLIIIAMILCILILALIIYGFEQGAGSMGHGATGFGLRAEGIGHGVARLETGFVGLNHLWPVILGCIYIGIFEMGVAYVFWLKGLQLSTTTARVSSLIFFAPFISLIIINVAVGETIHLSTLAGLIFIIGGLLFQRIFERTTNQN